MPRGDGTGPKAKGVVKVEEWAEKRFALAVETGVLMLDMVRIASAPAVVHEECMNWGFPAISGNAQCAVRP